MTEKGPTILVVSRATVADVKRQPAASELPAKDGTSCLARIHRPYACIRLLQHIRSNPLAPSDLDDSVEREQSDRSLHLAKSPGPMRLTEQHFPRQSHFREQRIAMV
ncbi:hypothetical protein RBWH47_00456 [Rhodopirellula baltica WH47]|uniref:Uncharacterized protein n=1 Tax=Rhodopirellula baltica WH47 TaxID=991778 RepID=F2AXM8_RHOBT|nr:hypothetical protein RBWH47_00456 [Rhodopirellula baltica WH47]